MEVDSALLGITTNGSSGWTLTYVPGAEVQLRASVQLGQVDVRNLVQHTYGWENYAYAKQTRNLSRADMGLTAADAMKTGGKRATDVWGA